MKWTKEMAKVDSWELPHEGENETNDIIKATVYIKSDEIPVGAIVDVCLGGQKISGLTVESVKKEKNLYKVVATNSIKQDAKSSVKPVSIQLECNPPDLPL